MYKNALSCTPQPLSLPPQSLIGEASYNLTTADTKEEIKAARGETAYEHFGITRDSLRSVGFIYGRCLSRAKAVSEHRVDIPSFCYVTACLASAFVTVIKYNMLISRLRTRSIERRNNTSRLCARSPLYAQSGPELSPMLTSDHSTYLFPLLRIPCDGNRAGSLDSSNEAW